MDAKTATARSCMVFENRHDAVILDRWQQTVSTAAEAGFGGRREGAALGLRS